MSEGPSDPARCPADGLVLALCLAHVLLWSCVALRNRGAARWALLALLGLHTRAWGAGLSRGHGFRGHRRVCGRTYSWSSFRPTREALAEGKTLDSPDIRAFGEDWYLRVTPNSSGHVAAFLARRPKERRRGAPPLVEVTLRLGARASEPHLSRFEDWPYIEGHRRFAAHDADLLAALAGGDPPRPPRAERRGRRAWAPCSRRPGR